MRGHEDDLRVRRVRPDAVDQLDAGRVRQAQVGEDEVEGGAFEEQSVAFGDAAGGAHLITAFAEDEREGARDARLVIHDEDSLPPRRHAPSASAGRRTVTSMPAPGLLSTPISPPCSAITFLA